MFLKLILSYISLSIAGYYLIHLLKINETKIYKKQLFLTKVNFNAICFFAIFCSLTHLVGMGIGSFSQAFFTSVIASLVFLVFCVFIKKIPSSLPSLEKWQANLILFSFAIIFSISYFIKDAFITGSWDSILHAYTACLVKNDFYPPFHPNNINVVLDHYHYGTNLVEGMIQVVTGAEIWDTMSLQCFIGLYVCFLGVVFLVTIFTENFLLVMTLSIFVTFFNSLNFWELLFTQYAKFAHIDKQVGLAQTMAIVSKTSVKSIATRLSYYGWSIGFAFLLPMIAMIFITIEKTFRKRYLILIFCLSLMLYFTYPPMWYPVLAALVLLAIARFAYNLSQEKDFKFSLSALLSSNYFMSLFIFIFAKPFTFTSSLIEDSGEFFLKFKPQLATSIWPVSSLSIFESQAYLRSIFTKFHDFENTNFFNPPLFSMITFKEFGLVVIVAIIVFFIELRRQKLYEPKFALFYAGISACFCPYLLEFVLRPIEAHRFIVIGKGILLLYIAAYIADKLKNEFSTKLIVSSALLVLISLPGMALMWSLGVPFPAKTQPPMLSKSDKLFVQELEKIHEPGLVALDNVVHGSGTQLSSFAGFYSSSGEYMKLSNTSRNLALKTLNPFLLNDLEINYLFISKDYKVDKQKINNIDLFTKVDLNPELNWNVYKFNRDFDREKYKKLNDEYVWTLAYENKDDFKVFDYEGKQFVSKDRKKLEEIKEKYRQYLLEQGDKFFVWTKPRAVLNPNFK